MSREWTRTAAALGVAAAVVLGLRAALVHDATQPNWEFFPDMARSPAWQAQFDGAPTPDGLTDQPLAAGVVPRGPLPFRYGATPEEAERAGRELTNPFTATDPAAAARGAVLYARFCVACHGALGEGDGLAVRRGMIAPPSLKAARALQMKDGQVFHILTKGQGNMPSYALQIAPEDRWKVILQVRTMQHGSVR